MPNVSKVIEVSQKQKLKSEVIKKKRGLGKKKMICLHTDRNHLTR